MWLEERSRVAGSSDAVMTHSRDDAAADAGRISLPAQSLRDDDVVDASIRLGARLCVIADVCLDDEGGSRVSGSREHVSTH